MRARDDAVPSCREVWETMTRLTAGGRTVRNFHADMRMDDIVIETELFPRAALEVYSAWNLGHDVSPADRSTYFSEHRGGGQGDYREAMTARVANVVECLTAFPASKRAVISVVPTPDARHDDDAAAKCMREIHFHLDASEAEHHRLDATVLFRSQAAEIFPKNIHFIGSLMREVAVRLPAHVEPSTLHYLATVLVSDRW